MNLEEKKIAKKAAYEAAKKKAKLGETYNAFGGQKKPNKSGSLGLSMDNSWNLVSWAYIFVALVFLFILVCDIVMLCFRSKN